MEGHAFKIKNDPRITHIGKFLRASCIDELPQLINVFRGEMSFVGPRPPLPNEVKEYTASELERLSVIPGLTCFWQIQPDKNSLAFDEWVELDKKYIRERSFWIDMTLICKTIVLVLHLPGC